MKPLPVAIVAAVILALLWWFWPRDKWQEQASADASKAMVASTPAPGGSSAAAPTGTAGSASTTGTAGSASTAGASDPTSTTGATGSASTTGATGSASTTGAGGSASASGTPLQAAAPAPKAEAPLVATVYFDFDRSGLRPGETPTLDAFVMKLKDRSYSSVVVKGYADRIGEAPHNDALSRKRAEAAVAYLTSHGVDAAKSHPEAKGESEPVTGDACKDLGAESATNRKLVDCLQKDRRVEIAVVN